VIIVNSIIQDHVCIAGCGIYAQTAHLEVYGSFFVGNNGTIQGAGIESDNSTVDLWNTTFSENTVGILGAAFSSIFDRSVTVMNCNVVRNAIVLGPNKGYGGSIIILYGPHSTFENTIISDNDSGADAAGLLIEVTKSASITNCSFYNNHAVVQVGYIFGVMCVCVCFFSFLVSGLSLCFTSGCNHRRIISYSNTYQFNRWDHKK